MDTAFEARALSILAIASVTLLVVVTGGIVYLTLVEWRDRRRKSRADLDNLPRRRNVKAQGSQAGNAKAKSTKTKTAKAGSNNAKTKAAKK